MTFDPYSAHPDRYSGKMLYRRVGRSGLLLPAISLGLWHNFGGMDSLENSRAMLRTAFDIGITHFDLANNYGPPPGSAEETFGLLMDQDWRRYRDELIISTKAGYRMQPGPYGEFGSRKYLIASLDQSLKRMRIPYVDIFYSHCFDPNTPLEETMGALDFAVRSGRALYVGISSYDAEHTRKAAEILQLFGTPCLIHQPSYSMFNRFIEQGTQDAIAEKGLGTIAFSPLAQGLLTDKYLNGIPNQSRAAKARGGFRSSSITQEKLEKVLKLSEIAKSREQTLAQMALAWVLRGERVTSALIGASSPNQVIENAETVKNLNFTKEELDKIEEVLR